MGRNTQVILVSFLPRYIKTTAKALIEHLSKYLAMRISLDLPQEAQAVITGVKKEKEEGKESKSAADFEKENKGAGESIATPTPSTSSGSNASGGALKSLVKDLSIYVAPSPNNLVELAANMSLAEVNERHWKVNKPLEMYYSFTVA